MRNALLILVAAVLIAGCHKKVKHCDPPSPPSGGLATAPLKVVRRTDNGSLGYAVKISVGCGEEKQILLDTGSNAMLVKASALLDADYTRTGEATEATYGDGTQWRGEVATAYVTINGVPTTEQVKFQVVDIGPCDAVKDDCPPHNRFDPDTVGIMGASLRAPFQNGMYSVILQLAPPFNTHFVLLPPTAPDGDGTLAMGPDAQVGTGAIGFSLPRDETLHTQPNGVQAWDDFYGPMGCVGANHAAGSCTSMLFDSGTADIIVAAGSLPDVVFMGQFVRPGTFFAVTITDRPDWEWSFTVGNPPKPSVDRIYSEDFGVHILGFPFFATHAVLLDADEGRVTFWSP